MGDELFLTIPAIIISAAMIFVFNYFFTFRSSEKAFRLKKITVEFDNLLDIFINRQV